MAVITVSLFQCLTIILT